MKNYMPYLHLILSKTGVFIIVMQEENVTYTVRRTSTLLTIGFKNPSL